MRRQMQANESFFVGEWVHPTLITTNTALRPQRCKLEPKVTAQLPLIIAELLESADQMTGKTTGQFKKTVTEGR